MVGRNVDRITVDICIQQLGRVEKLFYYHMMRVCQRQRRHLWETLREWLSVTPFIRAFLKSPSSRGLSAIAELLLYCHECVCYFACSMFVQLSLKLIKGNLLTYLGPTYIHRVSKTVQNCYVCMYMCACMYFILKTHLHLTLYDIDNVLWWRTDRRKAVTSA